MGNNSYIEHTLTSKEENGSQNILRISYYISKKVALQPANLLKINSFTSPLQAFHHI